MNVRLGILFILVLLQISFTADVARAATISGTVTNSSGKTGRIYLSVHWAGGGKTHVGVSIPAAGNFTIDGVQPNSNYIVKAFMDVHSTNFQHANDPSGASAPFYVSASTGSAGAITLANPAPVAAQEPDVMVFRANGGNGVMWDGPQANDLTIADKYTVSWSTSASGSPVAGSQDVLAGFADFFTHNGGATNLYYQVTAVAGVTTASSPWRAVPAASASGSVTGKVFFSGTPPAAPLCVILVDDSTSPPKLNSTTIANPASGASYTINNVPAGTYFVVAFLDLNNNRSYDLGDVGWLDNDDFHPRVTVSTTRVSATDITLNNVNSSISLYTQHGKSEGGEWYNIYSTVQSMKKRVVNVEILSGPQISSAVDVALDEWQEFNAYVNVAARPTVGDTYQLKVSYSDGTTETVSRAVTAVLDALPTPLAPVGSVPFNPAPTFSWRAPSPAPAEYLYSLWSSDNHGQWIWEAWAIPSSTTSLVYASQGDFSQDTLSDGTTYYWTISVKDRDGNEAQNQTSFTFTTTPSIAGFSPPGGSPGTTVTITGFNFNPNPSANTVFFNGVAAATPTAATSTSLTVTVPVGATTGPITVSTAGGTSHSASNFLVQLTLSATIDGAGTGNGTVYISPPDPAISFSSGTQTSLYGYNTLVTLTAAPANSALIWSGCNAASDNTCNVTMDRDKSVTATFTVLPYVRILGLSPFYGLLQPAYDAASDGAVIMAQGITLAQNLTMDDFKNVTIEGGYNDSTFNPLLRSGITTLQGVLIIELGSLTANKLAIK